MRSLVPECSDSVDPATHIAAEPRRRGDRPWLMLNMVASLDGGTAIDGRSGGLGGPADRAVFMALRAVADIVLVAAGTVRAENYGRPRLPDEVIALRLGRGQSERPRLAIVTRSADLDPSAGLFDDDPAPLVITTEHGTRAARDRLGDRAEVLAAGEDSVDLTRALAELGDRGAHVVLCEGGPSLNGQLIAQDLVDELDLSIAPLLVAGDSARVAHGPNVVDPNRFALVRLFEQDDALFARYCRR